MYLCLVVKSYIINVCCKRPCHFLLKIQNGLPFNWFIFLSVLCVCLYLIKPVVGNFWFSSSLYVIIVFLTIYHSFTHSSPLMYILRLFIPSWLKRRKKFICFLMEYIINLIVGIH